MYYSLIKGGIVTIQEYLDFFQEVRGYSEDLPERFFGTWHPEFPNLKGRGNVFFGVYGWMTTAVREKKLSRTTAIELFLTYEFNCYSGEYTTQDELTIMNEALDEATKQLKKIAPKK